MAKRRSMLAPAQPRVSTVGTRRVGELFAPSRGRPWRAVSRQSRLQDSRLPPSHAEPHASAMGKKNFYAVKCGNDGERRRLRVGACV